MVEEEVGLPHVTLLLLNFVFKLKSAIIKHTRGFFSCCDFLFIMIMDPIQKISSARLNLFPSEQKVLPSSAQGVAPTPTQKLDLHEK